MAVDGLDECGCVGEIPAHNGGSYCHEVFGPVFAGGDGDYAGSTVERRLYVVRGISDQDGSARVEDGAVSSGSSLPCDAYQVGAGVVVGTVGAAVHVEVAVQAEGAELDFGGRAGIAGQDRLDQVRPR